MNEEEIIAIQKLVTQEHFSSIYSPFTSIAGKKYHFVEQDVPIAHVLMHMPREFIDLPAAIARQKYPSENRPKIIKSSLDMNVFFAFNTAPQQVQEDDLLPFRDSSLEALKRLYPQNTYLERGLTYYGEKKNKLFSWYEYYGPTMGAETYSFYAFLRENDRLLLCVFNCFKDVYESWRPIIFEAISSVRKKPIGWKGDSQS